MTLKIDRVVDQDQDQVELRYDDQRQKLSQFKERLEDGRGSAEERRVSGFGNFESKEQHAKRRLREQIKVYFITYFSYAVIHFQREFWSMSKTNIKEQFPDITNADLSRFDTA